MFEKLEGKYHKTIGSNVYELEVLGPTISEEEYGDAFNLIRTENQDDGAGHSEWWRGPYRLEDGKLVLDPKEVESESWFDDEEAEGEAFAEPWNEGPFILEIIEAGIDVKLKFTMDDVEVIFERKE